MIPHIEELLHITPFSPFTVRTSHGREYIVPTPDHAAVNPKGAYVVVFSDNDSHAGIAGLHVAAVVNQTLPCWTLDVGRSLLRHQCSRVGASLENVFGGEPEGAGED
ncbi:MAG: hypothetical protein DLM73_15305 [Chthoniobacterales bacterium]|nr:MAG: hypothetical protein DLM73_15305 [Chthoniobacterales bacterium]